MQRLLIETDSIANANFLASFLRTVKSVKKVIIESAPGKTMAEEPSEPYNWTNPMRPATDEEFGKMIAEAKAEHEAGLGLPLEKARSLTMKKLAEWRKKKRK